MGESGDGGAAGDDGRSENRCQCEHGALCVHACVLRPRRQTAGERTGKLRQRFGSGGTKAHDGVHAAARCVAELDLALVGRD